MSSIGSVKPLIYFFIILYCHLQILLCEELNPNFDDPIELSKIIDEAIVGKWNEFSNKSLPFDEFRQKNGVQYEKSSSFPYSGYYVQLDEEERIRNLRTFHNGLLNGITLSWRKNGLKFFQGNFKEGKKDGVQIFWSEKNKKTSEQIYKDGKLDGLSTKWYLNGNKSSEQIFSRGKLISAVGWKPNGDRCPSTRVREGVGVLVSYSDFGDESKRENFTNDEKKKVVEKYTNGKTREEGYYKNGRKDGLWIYYRLDGNENFRITYQEGKRINTEFP